jgi:hypothetical protein
MQPQQPYGGPPAPLQPHEFEFITNPNKPGRRGLGLGNSTAQRLLVVLGGVFVLVIIVVIIAKLLSHTTNALPALTAVGEQQQELIHLTGSTEGTSSGSGSAPTLSTDHQNVQATIQLVLTSNQTQLLTYLSSNHYKVKTALVTGYANSSLDQQLTAAATNGSYDATFASIIQSQLNSYETALKQAYLQVTGPKGRAMLNSDYSQAQLLQQQLTSPAS